MKVIAYTRVSTSEQGKSGLGLEAQIDSIKRFCAANGLELVQSYEEVISGKYFLSERPVLQAAFKQAERLGATVIVSKLDRLSRSVEMIAGLMNRANFVTAEDGLACPPIQLHLKAAIAENERKMIGERTKAALSAKAARGEPLGSHTHRDPVASKERAKEASAKVVKAEADLFAHRIKPVIMRMRTSGMTVNAIAQELNEQGNRTARGGQWHASTVCNILKRLEMR